MDFVGGLREKTLGEVASTLATEGIGVGVGFIGASTIGRRIEDYFMKIPLTPTSSLTEKAKGWAFNNVPKVIVWYILRGRAVERPTTSGEEIVTDAKKAIAGSVAFDTVLRLANGGVPVHDPSSWKLLGGQGEVATAQGNTQNLQEDVRKLNQENSALRGELNKALQKLASIPIAPSTVAYQPTTPPARLEYPEIREKKYGFMANPPGMEERERKYGFASEEGQLASMFGMK